MLNYIIYFLKKLKINVNYLLTSDFYYKFRFDRNYSTLTVGVYENEIFKYRDFTYKKPNERQRDGSDYLDLQTDRLRPLDESDKNYFLNKYLERSPYKFKEFMLKFQKYNVNCRDVEKLFKFYIVNSFYIKFKMESVNLTCLFNPDNFEFTSTNTETGVFRLNVYHPINWDCTVYEFKNEQTKCKRLDYLNLEV